MSLEIIERIARNYDEADYGLFRSLVFGFLRGSADEDLLILLKERKHDKIGFAIFTCFHEKASPLYINKAAKYFLREVNQKHPYKETRGNALFLSRLYDKCSFEMKRNIALLFINSEKRYFRKYAYNMPLYELGDNFICGAFSAASKDENEMSALAKTITYKYPDDVLEKFQQKLQDSNGVEEYQMRKLFSRKSNLSKEDWVWLKKNMPVTYVYHCVMQNRPITDEECKSIYAWALKAKIPEVGDVEYGMIPEKYDGFLLWCFARMRKWSVIEEVLKEAKSKRR